MVGALRYGSVGLCLDVLMSLVQKNHVTPSSPLTALIARFGSWIPAHERCMYPTSKVRARLSRMNQCTPVFACRLNSKVPLASDGPMLVAETPAPKSANGIQRVP